MSTPCATCDADVSEWAWRCPRCGRTVDDDTGPATGPVPSPPGPIRTPPSRTTGPIRTTGGPIRTTGTARALAAPEPGWDIPQLPCPADHPPATAVRPAGVPIVPIGGRPPHRSATFERMVRLRRSRLEVAIDRWWTEGATCGFLTVQRRLRLGPPVGDCATGWRMTGRVWRLTPLHVVPVLLELWPVHAMYSRITLTPLNGIVLPSRRYFRMGHSILDRVESDLADASDTPPGPHCNVRLWTGPAGPRTIHCR